MKRITKTPEALELEYENDKWSYFDHSFKLDFTNVDETLRSLDCHWLDADNQSFSVVSKSGRLRKVKSADVFSLSRLLLIQHLIAAIDFYRPDYVIEIGSGLGTNFLELVRAGVHDVKFYSLEFSKSGRNFQERLFEKLRIDCNVGSYDIFSPRILDIPGTGLIFTSFVWSLMPLTSYNLIESVISSKPCCVINYEPIFEFNQGNTQFQRRVRNYIDRNDYNRNLFTVLEIYEDESLIEINEIRRNVFGASAYLPGSIIRWSPKILC